MVQIEVVTQYCFHSIMETLIVVEIDIMDLSIKEGPERHIKLINALIYS
jgi:hypothetical protein